ncbi:ABC transporter permease [Aeromicrobium endophyticum]|uniref:ABC transporter permease n=1 Tax=Aeromicrobium endophyticum TaxID=2292704 RepID=A0A371P5Y7_9ACTN|nr:ABC transporter permease [Aeromicrobium endophyticum]REK70958.1 ABC transporter permease [Aeromicrobium endophyticum]
MGLVGFIARRAAFSLLLLLIVSFLVFGLTAAAPGSQLTALLGGRPPTPEQVAALNEQYHLNDPFFQQYGRWLINAVQLDFGTSSVAGVSVTQQIGQYLPITAQLAAMALVLSLIVSVPAGLFAGIGRGGKLDRTVSLLTVGGMSSPPYAVGILLIFVLGVKLSVLPVYGAGEGGGDRFVHLILPAITLTIGLAAIVARQTRASTLTVMQQDYITFARARGLSPRRILVVYALRNSALPVVTSAGLLLISLISGAVLVEQVFSLPGLGQLIVSSVQQADLPVIQGVTMVLALVVILTNFAVELLSLLIDPRTRYAAKG